MAVHKLILDDTFDDALYTLIAIHCRLEDYRLAYLLNKYLGITLSRKSSDIDYKNGQVSYSIYEWEDHKQLITWSLVSNICKTEALQQSDYKSLFDNQDKITKTFQLLPEHKTVNYFLKIDSEFSFSKEKYILESILKIPRIATAYSLDSNKLKSKDNLIFN
ncbi:MAG: IPExxxVDY family protein [Algibacter sp.]|uniref:IPExxxVDY family protein n=1 Tax=Algibacter sp. TaxID=1872428 RepID=UPI0026060A79|nr:IPExxxVDY family protein [Algibacter sp.]MDG1728319.1 IPExxxVDY family protein [Algibacter sp.]MDG2177472.1 IPExxxVDY family protein [Algibacter sp.]